MSRPTPAAGRGRSFRRAAAGACLSASLVLLPLAMAPAAHAATAPVDATPTAVEATPAAEAPVAGEAPAATPTPAATPAIDASAEDATPVPAAVDEAVPVVDAPVEPAAAATPSPASAVGAPTPAAAEAPAVERPFTWTGPDLGAPLTISRGVPFTGVGYPGSLVSATYTNADGELAIAGYGFVEDDGTWSFAADFGDLTEGATTARVTVTQVALDTEEPRTQDLSRTIRFAEAPVGPFVRGEMGFTLERMTLSISEAKDKSIGIRPAATGFLRYEAVEVTIQDEDGQYVGVNIDSVGGVDPGIPIDPPVGTRSLQDRVRADADGTYRQDLSLSGPLQPGKYFFVVRGLESGMAQGIDFFLTADEAATPVTPDVPTQPGTSAPAPGAPSVVPAGTAPKPIAKPVSHGDQLPVTGTDGAVALGLGGLGALMALVGAGAVIVRRRLRSRSAE
ncbi:LPXTG-motif cell wall-anchored protein [Clavibacter michiganensis]|uniref:LPXTG cell wall anchor domain-containing protein n=1 Tax=Clavibacter michiganensis TaxID=28447 RepID=UPI001AE49ED9|nr:LPXTG cell wall anchor domain-containing protein [Clavibacter michiganensis]MBP2456925.1 LPXTG-motif cell wall-anchored protein [Clavibacter michiganensis]MDQ0409495.1 LPXTG-motif cell wall-anchored protein [Clavibacter michiganensis]